MTTIEIDPDLAKRAQSGRDFTIPANIAADIARDIEKFEKMLALHLAGEIEDDTFRVFRLNNGIYGQRQGGHNQMLRVKLPYGGITPEQFEMMAHIGDKFSRGWGHITTRQNSFELLDICGLAGVYLSLRQHEGRSLITG